MDDSNRPNDGASDRPSQEARQYEVPTISSYLPEDVEEVLAARVVRRATLVAAVLVLLVIAPAAYLMKDTAAELSDRQRELDQQAMVLDELTHELEVQLEKTRDINKTYAASYAQALSRFESDALDKAYEVGLVVGGARGVLDEAERIAGKAALGIRELNDRRAALDSKAQGMESRLAELAAGPASAIEDVRTHLAELSRRRQVGGAYSLREGTRRRLHGTSLYARYHGSDDRRIRDLVLSDSADQAIYRTEELVVEDADSVTVGDVTYRVLLRGVDRPFFRNLPWVENSTAELAVQVIYPPADLSSVAIETSQPEN